MLDLNCRAHEVHNLYVVDSSFFPSHASVSPGLTVIANALRVRDRLIEQLNRHFPPVRENGEFSGQAIYPRLTLYVG